MEDLIKYAYWTVEIWKEFHYDIPTIIEQNMSMSLW